MAGKRLTDAERRKREEQALNRKEERAKAKRQREQAALARKQERERLKLEKLAVAITIQPLAWPSDTPRTAPEAREKGAFRAKDVDMIFAAIRRTAVAMELDYCTIGIAVPASAPAMFYSDKFAEPGVTVYYGAHDKNGAQWNRRICLDKYSTCAANLRAVSNGLRGVQQIRKAGIEQWVQALDAGMIATLPLPDKSTMELRTVIDAMRILEIKDDVTRAELKIQHRSLIERYHPDKNGGNDASAQQINAAYAMMLKHIDAQEKRRQEAEARDRDFLKQANQRCNDLAQAAAAERAAAAIRQAHAKVKTSAVPPRIIKQKDIVDKQIEKALPT